MDGYRCRVTRRARPACVAVSSDQRIDQQLIYQPYGQGDGEVNPAGAYCATCCLLGNSEAFSRYRRSMGNGSSEAGSGGVQSVDRALSALEILARQGEVGVTELAADIGVHKSTAFRLLGALEEHEFVEQAHERGKYRLGFGILRL